MEIQVIYNEEMKLVIALVYEGDRVETTQQIFNGKLVEFMDLHPDYTISENIDL